MYFRYQRKSLTILNPNQVVENIEDKDMLLDIRVQTNTGDYVNIEIQYSAFSKNQYQRFQIYGASLLSRQEIIKKISIMFIR